MTSGSSYVDSCLLLSLLMGDSGYLAAEAWLGLQEAKPLWISHWVILEIAGVIALCERRGELDPQNAQDIRNTFKQFQQERLALVEPRAQDFLLAQEWLHQSNQITLRSGDALHLAIAKRHELALCSADRALIKAGLALGVPCELVG